MNTATRSEQLARRTRFDAWCASHHGVVSIDQLLAMGYSRATIYRLVARGELTIVLPGVFKASTWPTGRVQLMVAACLRNQSVSIGYITAGELWNYRRVPNDPLIHLLVPHTCSTHFDGHADVFVVHRCRQIDPVDIVQRDDGIRLVSPARAALDIADVMLDSGTASILEQLANDGRVTIATHAATLARLGHPRRPGTATMARVIKSRPKWRAALQSDLESRVLAAIQRAGLPTPEVQHEVRLPSGEVYRFDFAWPQFQIALEVDHPFWHAGYAESHRDKRRDRKLAILGWRTVRITDINTNTNTNTSGALGEAIGDLAAIIALAASQADGHRDAYRRAL